MTGNPYHEPETAAAIWNAAMNGELKRGHSRQLLDLIADVRLSQPIGPLQIVRSLEIVLSRVKVHERLRRDLMGALGVARVREAQRHNKAGPEWIGPGERPHRYSPDIMAQGDCRVCGHTWQAHKDKGAL